MPKCHDFACQECGVYDGGHGADCLRRETEDAIESERLIEQVEKSPEKKLFTVSGKTLLDTFEYIRERAFELGRQLGADEGGENG